MTTIDFDNLPYDFIYAKVMRDCEKKLLQWAYDKSEGVITEVAILLDMNRKTLTAKLEYYGIHTPHVKRRKGWKFTTHHHAR